MGLLFFVSLVEGLILSAGSLGKVLMIDGGSRFFGG
jgi:hypothetical protein